jgi:alpha-L-fucosidase
MLADIVSKNGNLLLSVPVRGNGTIDEDEIAFLEGMAAWMKVNSEAIFGTRPWEVYGEGPSTETKSESGQFGGARDVQSKPYTPEDIRFTRKGNTVYAILMAWPDQQSALIKALGTEAKHLNDRKIRAVSLLGNSGQLHYSEDSAGLRIQLPTTPPCDHAYVLKIETE